MKLLPVNLFATCAALAIMGASTVFAAETKEELLARAAGIAKTAAAEKKKTTRAELEQRPEVQRKTGGFVDVEAKGTAVIVVDGRGKNGGAPGQFAEVFQRLSKYNVRTERIETKSVDDAADVANKLREKHDAGYAIAVVEDPKGRGLAIFPEDRIAVVNATRYQGGSDPLAPETRIVKELWRALGFVSGIGYAPFKNDVFQPVFSQAELDALEYQVMQPLNFQKMYTILGHFNIKRSRHIPYRVAVMEGWAAPPTNDYQKAVWDQVKAEKERGPAKAIQIKP